MTVAQLGFQIDSSPAAGAASDLDKLVSSAARAELAANRTGSAGSKMAKSFSDVSPMLERITLAVERTSQSVMLVERRLAEMGKASALAAKGNTVLEKSAIEASSAYKVLETSLAAVTAAQRRGDAELTKSLASIMKQKDAIASLNVELQKLRSAPSTAQPDPTRPAHPPANNNHAATNAMFQFQDIAMTAAGGMSPTMIGLQQGSQLAGAFAGMNGKQVGSTLVGAFAGLLSPVSLATVGLTAAAAAAIQFGSSIFNSASKAEEVLEKHEATMERIKDLYDKAGDAGESYGRRIQNAVTFTGNQDRNRLELLMRSQRTDLVKQFGIDTLDRSGTNILGSSASQGLMQNQARGKYGPYGDPILKYALAAKDGKGDVQELNDEIFRIANDNSTSKKWQEYATTLTDWTKGITATVEKLKELNAETYKASAGQRGVLVNSPEYRRMLEGMSDADAHERLGIRDMRLNHEAELAGMTARSPFQRAAAARQAAAARTIQGESGPMRYMRIDLAGTMELARAENALKEARRDRALNLDKILFDQQNEIDLIGKTGGAAEALRKQYELTSQLRLEAARNGTEVDKAELALIKEKTEALAPLCDTYDQTAFAAWFDSEIEE